MEKTTNIYDTKNQWDYKRIAQIKGREWIECSIRCFISKIKNESKSLKEKFKKNWWVYHIEKWTSWYYDIKEKVNIKNYSYRIQELRKCLYYV